MLMSGINIVRASAKNITCVNQMRQFVIAMTAFPTENDGLLPIGEWNAQVQTYIDDGSFASCYKIAKCPVTPNVTSKGNPLLSTYSYTGVYWQSWTVGPNWATPPGALFAWPFWVFSPLKNYLAPMVHPAEKCMLTERWQDAATTAAGDTVWGTSNSLNDQSTRVVHNTRSNFGFADGHMQSLTIKGIKTFSETQWAGDTMWLPYNKGVSTHLQ